MITHLSEWAKRKPQAPFFCVQGDKQSIEYSYRRAHIAAAALARELERYGMTANGTLACTMYNGTELVLLSLAAAYGGYTLALLNPRLSADERQLRLVELENATGEHGMDVLTNQMVNRLLIDATGFDATGFELNWSRPYSAIKSASMVTMQGLLCLLQVLRAHPKLPF